MRLSPLCWHVGIRILNYLDDWLILAQSQAALTWHKTLLLSHLGCLGLRVNFAKSILSPSQQVSFLGTVIDSVQRTATVSAKWATIIQCHTAAFSEGTACPLKAFQKMLGLMAAASLVLQLGRLHMRPIQFWLKQRVPSAAWRPVLPPRNGDSGLCISPGPLEGLLLAKARPDPRHGAQKEGCHDRRFLTRVGEHCARSNRPLVFGPNRSRAYTSTA